MSLSIVEECVTREQALKANDVFYAEYEKEEVGWGVFGTISGYMYCIATSKVEAENVATEMNQRVRSMLNTFYP